MNDFKGKLVFLPGGSAGIGLAIAKKLAARGAELCLFARRENILREAAAEVASKRSTNSQRVDWRILDVAEYAQVSTVFESAIRDLGVPDVLINCAGRARPDYFENLSYERFDETLRINLYGCWSATNAVVPSMLRRGTGYIVNVSSLAGLIGVFGYTDYCASKFALIGFSEALRGELKPHGIAVSVLCPPDTDTPGFAEENRHKPAETIAASEGGGLLSADDVAEELLRGMARERFLIIPGREGKLAHLVKRFVPGLLDRIVSRRISAVARSSRKNG